MAISVEKSHEGDTIHAYTYNASDKLPRFVKNTNYELLWRLFETIEKLQIRHKIQTEFISKASHEIRIATESILIYSELLQTEPEKNKQEYIESIFRNARRLERLTGNILDLRRTEDKNIKLQKEQFDLNELISRIMEDFRNKLEVTDKLNNVKLKFESKGQVFVKADKHMITQVISNIIDNAFKFTVNGEIAITCDEKDDVVTVIIRDTGSGIESKILPQLFTKFTTMSRNGTGLGLYISKNIIESHGGAIFAENNSNGKGASFTFKLPNTIKENIYFVDHTQR